MSDEQETTHIECAEGHQVSAALPDDSSGRRGRFGSGQVVWYQTQASTYGNAVLGGGCGSHGAL